MSQYRWNHLLVGGIAVWATHPSTRKSFWMLSPRLASFAFRTTGGIIGATAFTPFVKGGTLTIGSFTAAAALGFVVGVGITAAGTSYLEDQGILRAGATKDYLNQHTSLEGLKQVYNVPKNIVAIGNHYF